MTFSRFRKNSRLRQRGSALLTVLWLSAALSAIAFTIANNVRAETERTGTEIDSLRCYYLAAGGVERALLHIQWGGNYFKAPMPWLRLEFPSGEAAVEIIPESSKLNVNKADAVDLMSVAQAAGASAGQAATIAQAILDWRSPAGSASEFDQFYLAQRPSFRARHASLGEIEEVLLVQGMTPDLFYGRYERDAQNRLVPRGGMRDALSVYGATGSFDVNTISPTLLRALGMGSGGIAALVNQRREQPFKSMDQAQAYNDGSPAFGRLGISASPVCTIRSTARLRMANGQLSDVRRTVSALVRFLTVEYNPPYHVLRWYDSAAPSE